MTSVGRNLPCGCRPCPTHEFGNRNSKLQSQGPARHVVPPGFGNAGGDLGDGDSIRMTSTSKHEDADSNGKPEDSYEEDCPNCRRQDDSKPKAELAPRPSERHPNCVVGTFLAVATAFVVIVSLAIVTHSQEITRLEKSVCDFRKQLEISENQLKASMHLNFKTLVDRHLEGNSGRSEGFWNSMSKFFLPTSSNVNAALEDYGAGDDETPISQREL